MQELFINKISKPGQVMISVSVVCVISALCYSMSNYLDYKVVALILLLTVSIAAVLFYIIPVFVTAISTALIWDYFFIPPHFTLQVGSTENRLTILIKWIFTWFVNFRPSTFNLQPSTFNYFNQSSFIFFI
jgi:two-component system sensor histidine kinase KdpD